jgi:serine/threonine-protein kinase
VRKPELGQVVGSKYRLLRELGRGGMATVFEAENTLTLKRAAVKWLHPQFHDEQRGLQRVIREARASSCVRHENVVDVYDVAEEGSSVYLIMELLQGEPLSAVLEREELRVHELIALLVPVMRGVAAAHAAGVVHRDIKPDNIFLAKVGSQERSVPKVIDFGISKVAESDPSNATRSGITMGTPRYASYEQLLGARDVDARTDVYAFGVILYEALTGLPPYGDAVSFAEQAVRFATQHPRPARALVPEVPAALDLLVQRALAKQRDDRTATMEELLLQLVPFADPAQYTEPLIARSQAAARRRSTVADGRAHVTPPAAAPSDHLVRESRPAPVRLGLSRARARSVALTGMGLAAMAFALLAMRFEAPRAHTPEPARSAAIAIQPTVEAPAEALPAPQPPLAPAPVITPTQTPKKRRVVPSSAPEPAPELHRAGPLRKSEF